MGADNCVDPDDFDQEDIDDDLFKNLQIADLEEIFNQSTEEKRSNKKPVCQKKTPRRR